MAVQQNKKSPSKRGMHQPVKFIVRITFLPTVCTVAAK